MSNATVVALQTYLSWLLGLRHCHSEVDVDVASWPHLRHRTIGFPMRHVLNRGERTRSCVLHFGQLSTSMSIGASIARFLASLFVRGGFFFRISNDPKYDNFRINTCGASGHEWRDSVCCYAFECFSLGFRFMRLDLMSLLALV